ncbi:mitochondrial proton/calcium exchanger protein [Coccinella septempunctata]|uniref:mitochondrial proton/calcium exchanger protein n=1 Tax=Coccinella septempunctata TaxID=41139 RepID=UPI001D06599A|nr:mitochondrial proton/calcium exchanger protein [Coccinella septempunctata]
MFHFVRKSAISSSGILKSSLTVRCITERECFQSPIISMNIINSNLSFTSNHYSSSDSTVSPVLYSKKIVFRNISFSPIDLSKEPLKPSSKVEVTVENLKKKKDDEQKASTAIIHEPVKEIMKKKSLKEKIVAELVHYYHGFRLLFIDMKISCGLLWRVLNGYSLSRREYRLLIRTTGDMFRLLPFSVFIIVPFMEFLLPVFIKFFPGMLPSTFQTASDTDDKNKKNLKVKLEMAKFLQETLDNMSLQHKDHYSEEAKQFAEWFHRVRTSGERVSNEEIMKYSKLFEDEITLDSLSRSQLVALCRVLEVQTLGTNNLLRFQLRMKLRSLAADDKMIQKEGIDALTLAEVQQACRSRGMRAYGLSEERLRSQLSQWLDLSLNEKVPPSLLLLSRALMLPETIPTSDQLKATISTLPDAIITQTKAAIGEKEGKIDNKVAFELLKEEERRIKEERKEKKEQEDKLKEKVDKETLVDTAPIISVDSEKLTLEKLNEKPKDRELETKDIEIIENALDSISKEKKFIVEKEELQDLKEELADYKEDVENLEKAVSSQEKPEIKESKAAKRLFNRVNKMIHKLDTKLVELNEKEAQLKKDLEIEETEKKKQEVLKIEDIITAIKQIRDVPDQSRLDKITKVLRKIDDDLDGSVKVEDVLKVIEIIGKENVNLSDKQVDELIELIDKEEILEVEDKIEKALQKDKEAQLEKNKESPGHSSTDSDIKNKDELQKRDEQSKSHRSK